MKRKFLLRFLLLLVAFCLFSQLTLPVKTAYASSWTESARRKDANKGNGLYSGASDKYDEIELKKPGVLEKFLSELLIGLGEQLENLLGAAHISLDNVIYGRVNGNGVTVNGNKVSLFTFELTKGNPYGLVGAALYQVFRMISYAVIAVIVVSKLSAYSFVRMTPQNLDKVKSSGTHLLLSFLLLALAPYLLDVVLYLRDVLLYMVSTQASAILFGRGGGAPVNITSVLREEADGRLVGSAVYVASVIYTLYLGFLYAGYAMSFLVCFAVFPLVVMVSNIKRDLLKNWVSTVSYFIVVPIMDAALLLIPAYMIKAKITGIIVLFTCMCMTQARSILSQLLGIQDKTGGMMGFAAMMAAGRLVGSAIGAGKTALGQLKGAKEDRNMAKYEEEMAAATDENSGVGDATPLNAQNAGIEQAGSRTSGASGSTVARADTNVDADSSYSGVLSTGIGEEKRGDASEHIRGVSSAQNASKIADKYANVDNFESGPLNNQISHAKKAELYRKRAGQRTRAAFGTLAGGAIGGIAGASAGLMLGPAATAMGASGGISAGSQVGATLFKNAPSMLGKGLAAAANMRAIPFGDVSDETIREVASMVPAQTYRGAAHTNVAPTVSSGQLVHDIRENLVSNYTAYNEAAQELNIDYYDHPEETMIPALKTMHANHEFKGLNKEQARDKFRERISEQYLEAFTKKYNNHPERVVSDNSKVEASSNAIVREQLRKAVFDKDNEYSFMSDQFLDNCSWFDL